MTEVGMGASSIIYANPCKTRSHIAHARASGVNRMTFDNVDELRKIAKLHPNAEWVKSSILGKNRKLAVLGRNRCFENAKKCFVKESIP